jgi:heat shock protein HslJ
MFGKLDINGRNINFGDIGTTKMFCTERGVMKLETDFINALEKVTRFENNGNNLKLYARNRLVLRFKGSKKSDSDNNSAVKLEDKKWVLESIKNRNLPKIEINPFINFDKAKSSAGGNTGCNVFGGSYTATGEKIRIFNIISTMRACIEDERMNVEREFKNGLQNANRFEIKGGKLNLYQDKTLLLTFRAENK